MSRLPMLLAAMLLGGACSWAITGTAAADSGQAGAAGRASTGHPGATGHRPRHARATCESSRRHRRRRRPCRTVARTIHGRRAHRHKGNTHLQTGTPSSPTAAGALHARRADHTGGPGREAGVTVSLPATTTATATATATATVANVLATPCQNTELTPGAGNLEQVETAIVCLVNQVRAHNDELPLQPNARLEQAAQLHSDDMVSEDYFAHIAPNGETPLDRVQASGYIPNSQVGYTIGENIAWGTQYLATPGSIVAAWVASPDHLANILDGEYRDTAVGVSPAAPPSLANGQAGAVYTQEFGLIRG